MRLSTPPGSCRSRIYCESLTTFLQLTSFMLLCVSSGWLSASMQSSSNVSSDISWRSNVDVQDAVRDGLFNRIFSSSVRSSITIGSGVGWLVKRMSSVKTSSILPQSEAEKKMW
jgi:hypothetical protein